MHRKNTHTHKKFKFLIKNKIKWPHILEVNRPSTSNVLSAGLERMWENRALGVIFTQHGGDEGRRKEGVEQLSQERPIEISQEKMEMKPVLQREGRAHLITEGRQMPRRAWACG